MVVLTRGIWWQLVSSTLGGVAGAMAAKVGTARLIRKRELYSADVRRRKPLMS